MKQQWFDVRSRGDINLWGYSGQTRHSTQMPWEELTFSLDFAVLLISHFDQAEQEENINVFNARGAGYQPR